MSDTVIKVDNLSKKYIISHQRTERYIALRDVMTDRVKRIGGRIFSAFTGDSSPPPLRPPREDFYALRDLSFEIRRGERVGIIGRNGAGKTTLLKLLSRITEPTAGRIEITGRVASLLEVGTGFHPELTGRENIFLNGAILGMSKAEIRKRFDEIVDFAEIEKFLDTPVKRYSSGMYVRLSFAVAAHLEPDILIVDEVLAVGDIQFQKKCLGKMGDIAQEGRTVLFVSHNMGAVLSLCNDAILLDRGRLLTHGAVSSVVDQYLDTGAEQNVVYNLENFPRVAGLRGKARLSDVRLINNDKAAAWKLPFGHDITVEIKVKVTEHLTMVELGLALKTVTGFEIASSLSSNALPNMSLSPGTYYFRACHHNLALAPGVYRFGLGLRSERGYEDYLPEAFEIEILVSEKSAEMNAHKVRGAILPDVSFDISQNAEMTKENLHDEKYR